MYISMKFGMAFMYFAGKLVYLIILASVQLAVMSTTTINSCKRD